MKTITSDMKVAEAIAQCPDAVEIFRCRGCPDMSSGFFKLMSHLMSIKNAARIHKIDLEPLLEELNVAADIDLIPKT